MIKKQDGQSLVEFALVLPILLLLLVGIFDFGRILYTHLQLEMVAQESVRMGGLGNSDETIRSYAANQFHGDSSKLKITITPSQTIRKAGDYVTVSLAYPEEFMNVLGDAAIPYTVKSSSTIRVE
ncbi:pilus assembly protein [Oceanobacillus piezotolerans]|uniref:Pilus assembly protein n=1 Tax=Oceanobacillus piezotolerans TaxID=2448030 RepID=A0A498DGF9_9BACI|nr:TadE/TadG family type IV pilus assembly protein [Oceanobacillus piezotolerans]RLL47031.1 pilus assembly protein [Oceanobacillus piezotolerans]